MLIALDACITSSEFTNSFSMSIGCYEACKDALNHPVFSEEHSKNGVDGKCRELVKSRIDEIETSLLLRRNNNSCHPQR